MSIDPSAIPNFGGVPRKPEEPQEPQEPQQAQERQEPQQAQEPQEVKQPQEPSGGQGETRIQAQAKKQVPAIVPDQDLIKQILDRMKLKHTVDKQGDVVAPWKRFRTYFMVRGEDQQRILSVRTFYHHPHGIEDKPRLLENIDEWNRRTLWPKIYTHTNDEGTVRMIGEAQMLVGMGVAPDHFVSTVVSWVRASIEFDKWLSGQLKLDKDGDKPE